MPVLFSDIVRIEYKPSDLLGFQKALIDGEIQIDLLLKDGRFINATKPIRIQKDDGNLVYLKIPNPCNHNPQISYIEACIAKLAHDLLLPRGVVVPEYEIIELDLTSPFSELKKTPCCLIEALESFTPFGDCGDDFNADPSKVKVERLTDKQRSERLRKSNILFSKEFAAFAVVSQFIGNNDPHQENFGSIFIEGSHVIAAIDFDMAPMAFLNQHKIFGPFNVSQFNDEHLYHDEEGGRHTPYNIDISNFPTPLDPDRCPTPDNWFTKWCHGFKEGLIASGKEKENEFHDEVKQMFRDLANLSDLFFVRTFDKVITKKTQASHQDASKLVANLVKHFQTYTAKLKRVVASWQLDLVDQKQTMFAPPSFVDFGNTPLLNHSMFRADEGLLDDVNLASNRKDQMKVEDPTNGRSPDMPDWQSSSPLRDRIKHNFA